MQRRGATFPRIGSLSAVEHILPKTGGMLTEQTVKTGARRAIERIQKRSCGGEAGGLSVHEQDTAKEAA